MYVSQLVSFCSDSEMKMAMYFGSGSDIIDSRVNRSLYSDASKDISRGCHTHTYCRVICNCSQSKRTRA